MHVELTNSLRGPVGSVHQVYLKIVGWYVIHSTEGYSTDNSRLQYDDKFLYEKFPGFFKKGENLPPGFTYVNREYCKEVVGYRNNKEAKHLLKQEH